jgi:hypothetical protein
MDGAIVVGPHRWFYSSDICLSIAEGRRVHGDSVEIASSTTCDRVISSLMRHSPSTSLIQDCIVETIVFP